MSIFKLWNERHRSQNQNTCPNSTNSKRDFTSLNSGKSFIPTIIEGGKSESVKYLATNDETHKLEARKGQIPLETIVNEVLFYTTLEGTKPFCESHQRRTTHATWCVFSRNWGTFPLSWNRVMAFYRITINDSYMNMWFSIRQNYGKILACKQSVFSPHFWYWQNAQYKMNKHHFISNGKGTSCPPPSLP